MEYTIINLVCMSIALAIGFAMGRASPQDRAQGPSGDYQRGYKAGWTEAHEEAVRLAKAHDFAMIELQLERSKMPGAK